MGLLRALPIEGAEITRNIGIRMLAERSLSDIGKVFVEAILKATDA